MTTRYFGGHRTRVAGPSAAQIEHAARVDELLVKLLGGVPTGRPPRPAAVVLPFPVRVTVDATGEAVAA